MMERLLNKEERVMAAAQLTSSSQPRESWWATAPAFVRRGRNCFLNMVGNIAAARKKLVSDLRVDFFAVKNRFEKGLLRAAAACAERV